ncbi:MAG: Gfo/Idh/MocA family oxidoreductase [Prolixibacteraceae bacterium]|jgi:predicted dehydrogenase|nr:Gfo/Idh/MocA family oxidoreductase [Prolixibacteraceae bacterium]
MEKTRRDFIRKTAIGTMGLAIGGMGMPARSYGNIMGANDKVKVGILGFSGRFRGSLGPAFLKYAKEMNFELVTVCDIWNRRRDEGQAWYKQMTGRDINTARNTDELWEQKPDAVIISTADFQHALHLAEAVKAGCDVYCEKPFAETMDDANVALKAAKQTGKVIQIGSQRRSGPNYHAAHDYIQSGKFGKIIAVEMTWNVNQPGRWRLPELTMEIKESDTDWKRYLMNRPYEPWDARKYLEYRLFWPYSSGIPGQWMSHQIDTVHWFSHLQYPRSAVANGGIYMWKDGRSNFDTMTAVFDYGSDDKPDEGFQVIYSSRQTNSSGGTKEWYFSNGGKLDLDTNKVNSDGGLNENYASRMGMKPFLLEDFELPQIKVEAAANTGADPLTNAHMKNWMDCVRAGIVKTNAPVEAGYSHSIATIMVTAALRTGQRATFDEKARQVMAGGKVFKY